ncbi:XdhC family protein [Congregibacter variabilis]|uniref:XdhC family protein n=1 Tax=Congregibacter variabilis TaxID=3081200 RepID=A0ABZ0I5U1_9GAMM|nr:XdhC family protein [Congregibacter sp. IMCC43200]
MQTQDDAVLSAALDALRGGQECWLATVVAVHGSSPRPPGSLALFLPPQSQVGSLSGGCVEEELLASIVKGEFSQDSPEVLQYGVSAEENARLGLPCGGHLTVFLQFLHADRDLPWLESVRNALDSRQVAERFVDRKSGDTTVNRGGAYGELEFAEARLSQCFGPRQRMLLIGAGQLAASVAELALGLDYDVLVCDPRADARASWRGPVLPLLSDMPDDAVRAHADDPESVVITLTHDPRIDDMALMEALESKAWYVGALGSVRTTLQRKERLSALGVPADCIERLHAPVGLDIGSKTPPEIAVSIVAELIRLRRRGA